MYVLKVDQPLTRRKTLHHIVDQEGDLVYSSGKVGPCIAWLHMRGESELLLEVEAGGVYPVFLVKLIPITPATTAPGGAAEPGQDPE